MDPSAQTPSLTLPRATGGGDRSRRPFAGAALFGPLFFLLLCLASSASAAPSQEDVFRSIQDSVGGETESPAFLPYAAGIAGLLLLVLAIGQRKKKVVVATRSLNHHGKLMREILKTVPLRAAEVKQLKTIAENTDADGAQPSPLVLLLCPSLIAKTVQTKRMKLDRRAMASIARKAGLQVTRK